MMYQCIKQYGSIKTGSFWDVEKYIVNSDGERRKVIITNEENSLLLSMTEFENHFTQVNELLTEYEYLQTCSMEQLAEVLYRFYCDGRTDELQRYVSINKKSFIEWLKQPHTKVLEEQEKKKK